MLTTATMLLLMTAKRSYALARVLHHILPTILDSCLYSKYVYYRFNPSTTMLSDQCLLYLPNSRARRWSWCSDT